VNITHVTLSYWFSYSQHK